MGPHHAMGGTCPLCPPLAAPLDTNDNANWHCRIHWGGSGKKPSPSQTRQRRQYKLPTSPRKILQKLKQDTKSKVSE